MIRGGGGGGDGGDKVQLLRAGLQHAQLCHCFVFGHAARIFLGSHGLFPFRFLVGGVTVIGPRRRIFPELLADHLFRDVDGNVLVPIVDREGQTNELRQDRGTARPDLDHFVLARFSCFFGLFQDVSVNEWAFPD